MTGTPASLLRRYVVLTTALWLPTGVTVPVLVLVLSSRGIELPTVGMLFALYGALVIALEIPSGGFADLVGRQRTMMLAGAVRVVATGVLAVGHEVGHFAGGLALYALSRALQSGPLEAWYVDSVHAADPDASVRRGISRGWAAEAAALAVGAVLGGFLPRWFDGLPTDGLISPFSVPFLISAMLSLLSLIAFRLLMTEAPREAGPGLRHSLRSVPSTVGGGLRLASRDGCLRILLISTLGMGFAISALEVLAPVQFAAQLGGEERASAAYGVLATLAFLGTAGGSMAAPRAAAALSGSASRAAAVFTGATALALLGLAVGQSFAVAAAAYVAVYLIAGVPGPLQNEIAHSRVGADQRATLLSVNSLALHVGGVLGGLTVPAFAGRLGFGFGWAVVAGVVLSAAGVLLLLPREVPALERTQASVGRARLPLLAEDADG